MVQGGYFDFVTCAHGVLCENTPSCHVMHGRRLCRDVVVVLLASIAIWIPDILLYLT